MTQNVWRIKCYVIVCVFLFNKYKLVTMAKNVTN